MEKTIILLDDERNMVFEGNIKPEGLVGLNLQEEVQEVVDGIIVHCYSVKQIEARTEGTIINHVV